MNRNEDTDRGYTVEMEIPWETLSMTATTGQTLGFDVTMNDRDERGDRSAITWSNRDGDINTNNPDGWGVLVLSHRVAQVP